MMMLQLACKTTKITTRYDHRDLSVLIGLFKLISTQKVLKTCNEQRSK